MALSVVAIKAAENRDKAYKLSDRDGLYLLVTPSGGRYWRINYRYLGKQKTLAFGLWPDTGLAEARTDWQQITPPSQTHAFVELQMTSDLPAWIFTWPVVAWSEPIVPNPLIRDSN